MINSLRNQKAAGTKYNEARRQKQMDTVHRNTKYNNPRLVLITIYQLEKRNKTPVDQKSSVTIKQYLHS